ncbi:MAG TPA: hypothetical protein VMU69_19090 [Bradyrhizobium sp.]|nr:hypothetical protein [Bradyrhizobium sp.]
MQPLETFSIMFCIFSARRCLSVRADMEFVDWSTVIDRDSIDRLARRDKAIARQERRACDVWRHGFGLASFASVVDREKLNPQIQLPTSSWAECNIRYFDSFARFTQ